MILPDFPKSQVPRCAACLLPVPARRFMPRDECSDLCIMKITAYTMGEKPGAHLHWECECGFVWATQTAAQSGHDPERQ